MIGTLYENFDRCVAVGSQLKSEESFFKNDGKSIRGE